MTGRIPMVQVGDVIISTDILTEMFCCDVSQCNGQCCIEGEAGAPLSADEVKKMETVLPIIQDLLPLESRHVIKEQGVSTYDRDGELVTQTVGGRECVFACKQGTLCLCASECAYRDGRTAWRKPVSCSLYPIREKRFIGGLIGLNLHHWNICEPARRKGRKQQLPVYRFLRQPLIERFGETWYAELEKTVTHLRKHRLL